MSWCSPRRGARLVVVLASSVAMLASSVAMLLEARWRHRDVSGAAPASTLPLRTPRRHARLTAGANPRPASDRCQRLDLRATSRPSEAPCRRLSPAGALRRGEVIGVARCGGRRVMLGPKAPWPWDKPWPPMDRTNPRLASQRPCNVFGRLAKVSNETAAARCESRAAQSRMSSSCWAIDASPQLPAVRVERLVEGARPGWPPAGVCVGPGGMAAAHSAARVLSVSHPAVASTVRPARMARWPADGVTATPRPGVPPRPFSSVEPGGRAEASANDVMSVAVVPRRVSTSSETGV